jgi:sec-independent protein translocase protein TatC
MAKKAATATAAPAEPIDEVEASRAPLMEHLIELRNRMTHSLIVVGVLFCAAWFVTDTVLNYLLTPLGDAAHRAGRPLDELFVAQTTAPLEMLFVKLKLAFVMALAVGFPFIAYQVYSFVAPGLYKNERMAVLPFLFVMPILFAAGAALVYFFVLPAFMDLSFSQELVGTNVKAVYVPKVKEYYELTISLLMCFGFAFQLPIVMSLLSMAGVIQSSFLRAGRKYALLVIFVVAAVVTPPDPFSQFILGVPLYFLYESGIIMAWLIERGRKRRDAADAKREEEDEKREAAEEARRRAASAATGAPAGTLPAGE